MEAAVIVICFLVVILFLMAITTATHLGRTDKAHRKLEEVVADKVGLLLLEVEVMKEVLKTHGWTDDLASERRRLRIKREGLT